MNWLFFILLIANLGLFVWFYPQQDSSVDTAQQSQDIGELLLAHEMPAQGQNIASPEETLMDTTVEPVTEPEVVEASPHPVPTLPQAPPLPVPTLPQAPPLPVPTLPQAPAIKDDKPEISSPLVEEKLPDKMQCRRIGMFVKRSQAELLSVQLTALGLKPEISSESLKEQAGYWVLIAPQKNRAAAVAVAKRLDEAGVADLWRFTSGNLTHAISLGLFKDQERAQVRRDQINKLGFDSEVKPRYRQQTQYWVKYSFSGTSPITEQKWREFESKFPGIDRSTAKCH